MPSAVKAFYEAIGGDYADAVARFSSEARLIRFLRKFPADDSLAGSARPDGGFTARQDGRVTRFHENC